MFGFSRRGFSLKKTREQINDDFRFTVCLRLARIVGRHSAGHRIKFFGAALVISKLIEARTGWCKQSTSSVAAFRVAILTASNNDSNGVQGVKKIFA